jgi:hypothetical protein
VADVEARDLRPEEIPAAVGVLARGMRDNPIHVAALGPDADLRRRRLEIMFSGLFRHFRAQQPICAVDGVALLGVTGVAPIGTCQPTPMQRLKSLPAMGRIGPAATLRIGKWLAAWAKRDPDEPHVHLGLLAVDAHLQGRGIGSRIMAEHCRRLDAAAETGYLETDKEANVGFYERHGFEVVGEEPVLGVPNWYMLRRPQRVL